MNAGWGAGTANAKFFQLLCDEHNSKTGVVGSTKGAHGEYRMLRFILQVPS